MRKHGTTSFNEKSYTGGQLATVISRIIIALPKALQLSNVDAKTVLECTKDGERMTITLVDFFQKIAKNHKTGKSPEYSIDCDADPLVPDGWSVENHQKGGQLKWDPASIELYFSSAQETCGIRGVNLLEELKDKPMMNANVIEFLIANPHLLPEEWKDKFVYFWGTIYWDSNGDFCVRYLDTNDTVLNWGFRMLRLEINNSSPAALRVTN